MFGITQVLTLTALSNLCTSAIAAPHSAPVQLIDTSMFPGLNLLSPPNLTLQTPPRTVTDPYDFHIEASSLTVEFYAYGPPLDYLDVAICCNKALADCTQHGGLTFPGRDRLMGTEVRIYKSSNTYLYLYPGDDMTWGLLNDLQMDIRYFQVQKLDTPRQTSFILLKEGVEGDVGYGTVSM